MTTAELAAAVIALILAAVAALASSLGMTRSMLVAAARAVLQLLLVGFVLRWLIGMASAWLTAAALVCMGMAATAEVAARQERKLEGRWHWLTSGLPVVSSSGVVLLLAALSSHTQAGIGEPRRLIPLAGIILGSAMNAASLSAHHLFETVVVEQAGIEARLALGADRNTAFSSLARRAIRAGTIPSLNQMASAGIVTIPGIMTGQLLAGVDPLQAAKAQIALLLLLATASYFAAFSATKLAIHRLSDERHRLRMDRMDLVERTERIRPRR